MTHPERWAADAGAGDVAQLEIPADSGRNRTFEIACSFEVRHLGVGSGAWHELKVLVDGALQWSRRVPTQPGAGDSLDVRFRRTVPSGQPLRLVASGQVHHAVRQRLVITADEHTD